MLEGLNPNQFKAVTTRSRSVLVLAGAGSGKTGVLTKRIAYLVNERGVSSHNILALTFTRKAASEMKERLTALCGAKEVRHMTIGTFHSVSLRILESYGYHLGYEHNLTVFDEIDQVDILSAIASELGMKDVAKKAAEEMQSYASDCDGYEIDEDYTVLLREYRNRLKEYNGVDFTLLLTEVLELFRKNPDVYNSLHDKFRYVFVDEYQDVDRTQYYLHEAIKPEHIFAVGDANQTIYSWRGSDISIIQDFEKAHPGSEVIILDQSYRCGSKILTAANNLISHNPKNYDIELWTEGHEGVIAKDTAVNPEHQAQKIADQIRWIEEHHGITPQDVAILTRTHREHQIIADTLEAKGIPCVMVGKETNYWKTTAARMILSVLKLLHNPQNSWHFSRVSRIVIYPMKDSEWYQTEAEALRLGTSALQLLVETKQGKFAELLKWYENNRESSLSEVLAELLRAVPIADYFLSKSLTTKAMDTMEVFSHAYSWEMRTKEMNESISVPSFLEWLASQEIQSEIRDTSNSVKISTIHAFKGLEIPVVFVAGMVEGKLPFSRSLTSGMVEEERRLAYVAVTRAKNRLYLSSYQNDDRRTVQPSRFIAETETNNTQKG